MILTVASQKGGVGKSTTAVNVAAAMVRRGRRVLLVDADAQCSATVTLAVPKGTAPNLADVLFHGVDAGAAVIHTESGVHLLPGSYDLIEADLMLASRADRAYAVRNALAPLVASYDVILIDTGPGVGLLVASALVASDAVITPVVPQYLAVHGLSDSMDTFARVRENYGVDLPVLGIVLTLCDFRTTAAREAADMLRKTYGAAMFKTAIRQSIRVAEAPSWGRTVLEHAEHSNAAAEYTALADEILKRARRL